MERRTKIILFIGGVIVGGAFVALVTQMRQQEKVSRAEEAPAAKEVNEMPPLPTPLLVDTLYENASNTTRVSLDVSYPTMSIRDHSDIESRANKAVKGFVDGIVKEFMDEENTMDMNGIAENFESTFTMSWEPMLVSPGFLSLRFDYSAYSAGAAHPNNMSRVFNYDLRKGRTVGTKELFMEPEQALTFLSTRSREVIKREMPDISEEEWSAQVLPGTEPIIENFREVALTKEGLVIIFNPYQIAAYAKGTQDILMRKEDVTEKLVIEAQNALNEVR